MLFIDENPDIELVDEIEAIEWEMFTKVHNIGRRANCQDDREQFSDMRRCNLLTWPWVVLSSYKRDLLDAREKGINLMAVKYAYMMRVTHPDEFELIKDTLPPVSPEKEELARKCAEIILPWEEELYEKYSLLRDRARSLYQKDVDASSISGTSFETYMYGELWIQSERTLRRYYGFLCCQRDEEINGSELVYENMARLRGWPSLAAAEQNNLDTDLGGGLRRSKPEEG